MDQVIFVSVKEAGRLTGLSRTTLYSMMAPHGVLRWTKCGRRRLILRASIEELLPKGF